MSPRERLERSVLIVPGSNPGMLAKAAAAPADAICIDLEDAVAPDAKAEARARAVEALTTLHFGGKLRLVRINGLDTAFGYRDLIEVAEGAGERLDLIVVPKVNGRDEVRCVDLILSGVEAACGRAAPIGVEALIETAAGMLNIAEIAAAAPRLEGLIFGSGDYAASVGMPLEQIGGLDESDALYPGHRWHQAMHSIVVAAHAHGLRAIDGPFAGFRDPEQLERMARIGRVMGFDGKWCIHPSQTGVVDRVFSPTEAEVARARAVVDAYAQATAAGRGAVSHDGKMIDVASIRMSETVLARAERARTRA